MSEETTLGLDLDSLGEEKIRLIPQEGGNKVKIIEMRMTTVESKETKQPIEAFEITFLEPDTGAEFVHRVLKPGYVEDSVSEGDTKLIGYQINALRHIAHGLLPKDGELPKGITWKKGDTFASLIKKLFENCLPKEEIKQLAIKIKAVYGKNSSFVQLPLFAPFFSTSNRKLKFEYNPEYDFLVPQGKKAQSEKGGQASGSKDLPFDDWD